MPTVQTPLEEQTAAPIAVSRIVSDAQVQSYLRDGFLAVEDLVTGDELEQLKRDVVRVARGDYGADGLDPLPRTPATRRCSTPSSASTSPTTSAR